MDKELYKKVQEIDVDWIDDEYKVKVLEAIELKDSNDLQHKKAVFERTLEYIDLRNDGCIKRLIDKKSWMWTDCNGKPYHYDLKGWCENELLESRNVNPILLYLSFEYELLKVVGEIKDEAKNKRLQELKSCEPINHSSQHKQASKRASSSERLDKALKLSVENNLAIKDGDRYKWIDQSGKVGLAYFMVNAVCGGVRGVKLPEKRLGELFDMKRLTQSYNQFMNSSQEQSWKYKLDDIISSID